MTTAQKQTPVEPTTRNKKLFCFGYGYTASFLSDRLRQFDWQIAGTTTDPEKKVYLKKSGIDAMLFDQNHMINDPVRTFADVTHVLLSIPPGAEGDPVAEIHGLDLADMKHLEWVGYLSTTAVYGNLDGGWADETTPTAPTSRRGSLRTLAEDQWRSLYITDGLPLHIFRLAGIYGPGRSAVDSVRTGTAKRIDKPDHVFNRIHVEDIVQTLIASMNQPSPGSIYNLSDDNPSPSHEVISFACNLAGCDVPPLIPYDQTEMAPIVRSFYKDNKRVRNDKIKDALGIELLYPDYRAGLQACMDIEDDTAAILKFEQEKADNL